MKIKSDIVELRPSAERDLLFVLQTEQDPEARPYVSQWSQQEHSRTLQNPDYAHLIVETVTDARPVGYVILQDIASPDRSLQFRRIVISERGKGYSKEVIKLVMRLAFEQLGMHRLWLDVKSHNERARKIYRASGFIEEGTLRECFKTGDIFESLVIMSVLRQEYEAGCGR